MILRPVLRPILRPVLSPVMGAARRAFNPRSLYVGGLTGYFRDPNDLSTSYQDSAGTTAGSAGNPVGLALDKSAGLVLGGEVVSNGGFDSDTVWSKGAGWAIGGGKATHTSGTSGTISQGTASAGSTYRVIWTVSGATTGTHWATIGGAASPGQSGNGTFVLYVTAVAAQSFGITASATFDGSIDNVSVRHIPGNHTTQSTATSRPQLVSAGGTLWDQLDGTGDFLTSTTGGGGSAGFFYCAAVTVLGGAGAARTLWADNDTNTGRRVRLNASNQLELAAGNGVAYTTAATVATASVSSSYILTVYDDGVNLAAQIGNGAIVTTARPSVSAGTAGFTEWRDNGASSSYSNVRGGPRVVVGNGCPSATQREQAKRWIASRAGISL